MNDIVVHNQSHAISLWAQAKAYEMVVAGMTLQETAKAITEMGRGIRPGRLEGVEYPPDYKISFQGSRKPSVATASGIRCLVSQKCDRLISSAAMTSTEPWCQ
jgi:hypothetical protein